MTPAQKRLHRSFSQFIMLGVQPLRSLFRGKPAIGQERERAREVIERLITVFPLDQNFLRNSSFTCSVGVLEKNVVTNQLLHAARFNAKLSSYLINGIQGNSFTHGFMISRP